MTQLQWWEKTVEYKFISWSKLQFDAIPLDGNMEQAGDTLFKNDENRFFLIEFKREKSDKCITSEVNKFDDYENALNQIEKNPLNKCHFVVYGGNFYKYKEGTKEELGFGLAFEPYFDFIKKLEDWEICMLGNSFDDEYAFFKNYAIDSKDFFAYLKFFCSLKKGKSLYGTSESPFANTLVATKDGAMVSLDELISNSPRLQRAIDVPEPSIQQKEPTREITRDGPSMGW